MGLKAVIRLHTGLFFALVVPFEVLAQDETRAEVEVSQQLQFNYETRPPEGGPGWLEVQVPINVRAATDSSSKINAQYVDGIETVLMLAFRVGTGSKENLNYYRSKARIATLQRGRHVIRFYLPPNVVDRDRLNSDPFAYAVQLSAEGREQPPSRNSRASLLRDKETFKNFLSRVNAEAPRNDGILVPIYHSPFADAFSRETPPFVRQANGF